MRPAVRRGRGDRKRRGGAAAHRPSPPGRWAEGGTGDGRGFFSPPSPPPATLGQGLSGVGSLRARLFIVDFTFFSFSFVGFIVGGVDTPRYRRSGFSNRSDSSGSLGAFPWRIRVPLPPLPLPEPPRVPPAGETTTRPGRASNESAPARCSLSLGGGGGGGCKGDAMSLSVGTGTSRGGQCGGEISGQGAPREVSEPQ